MTGQSYNVLFICTGNAARSILAESLINRWGQARFKGYSAGSSPKETVHPYALDLLRSLGLPVEGLRSKSWDVFAQPGAPAMDFVFTVCDKAAGESCPVWPGNPVTAHWSVPDPVAVEGPEWIKRPAFREALHTLENRIKILTCLRPESLDRLSLKQRVEEIGRIEVDQPADTVSSP
jgi:arsenate reductase (thioredoxin)